MPRKSVKPREYADRIFSLIPSHDSDDWNSGEAIASAADLTVSQVRIGIAYLKDHFPEFPLVSSPKGYRFTIEEPQIAAFRRKQVKTAYTVVRRLWRGTLMPYIEQSTTSQFVASLAIRRFEEVLAGIGTLINEGDSAL